MRYVAAIGVAAILCLIMPREVVVKVFSQSGASGEHSLRHACAKWGTGATRHNSARTPPRRGPVVGLFALGMLIAAMPGTALAQDEHKEALAVQAKLVEPATDAGPAAQPHPTSKLAGRYFVDFRARTAASYGHAFIWYGRLNSHGRVGLI